jgi:hypothetical protein
VVENELEPGIERARTHIKMRSNRVKFVQSAITFEIFMKSKKTYISHYVVDQSGLNAIIIGDFDEFSEKIVK